MDKRVAIVGYSFRFPGCDTDSFWQALLDRKDLVSEVEEGRWGKEALSHPSRRHSGTSYTYAAGSLGDVNSFDASFFGLSPREVIHMDPQHRLLLEMSWESIEKAGIVPSSLRGTDTGVFIGISSTEYAYRFVNDMDAIDANTATGTTNSIAANRISYLFDLKGPSLAIDTACSSSLVAFHQACKSILSGETTQALTGGISLHLHPYGFMVFSKATMLSPDGRCKPFDERGNGYVRSEGGGVFLLKDYHKALEDGDPVLAVVAGSAVNTDGYKSGLTVPNSAAQVALMSSVYERAGIHPDEVHYLEAHGTGTAVGDPVETQSIGKALGQHRSSPLRIGSIKSNLGHLEGASGVAGIAKALLAIEHGQVPATIGLSQPNANIDFAALNIEVVQEAFELPKNEPLVIGVNSFGFGGANAHVILKSPDTEEVAAKPVEILANAPLLPLRISARSQEALLGNVGAVAGFLAESKLDWYDLAWSSWFRRELHEQGLLVFATSAADAAIKLQAYCDKGQENVPGVISGRYLEQNSEPVFVYSGNGCQWAGMGRRLLRESALVRDAVKCINGLLSEYTDNCNLLELLGEGEQAPDCYAQTELAQPALFALQVAMTLYLREQGIVPAAVVGHSVGEVAAAWASGALTLEQAVCVIYHRSAYQGQTAGSGEMTAVATSAAQIRELLLQLCVDQVELAGTNSPNGVTLAGSSDQLTRVERELRSQGVRFKRLDLNYAFHSAYMDSIEEGLCEALEELTPSEGNVPYYSTVTGRKISGDELGSTYWWKNIRQPVEFLGAIKSLLESGVKTFVELGGHPVLQGYLHETLRAENKQGIIISSLSRNQDSLAELERVKGQALLSGAYKDVGGQFKIPGRATPLPTYVWQRESFVQPVTPEADGVLERYYRHPLLGYLLKRHHRIWESQIDAGRQPWLADHSVGGGAIFPAAGYVELMLSAAREAGGGMASVIELENLEILTPMVLDSVESKVVRTSINDDQGHISIQSRVLGQASEAVLHAKGRWFEGGAGLLLGRQPVLLPTCSPDVLRDEHLRAAENIGLVYGPAFQTVDKVWVQGHTVIATCKPDESLYQSQQNTLLPPGILDGAFQLFIPLMAGLSGRRADCYLPVQIGRLQLRGDENALQVAQYEVRLTQHSPHSLLADVSLFGQDGQAVAVLQDVRFKAAPAKGKRKQDPSLLDFCYRPVPMRNAVSPLNYQALKEQLCRDRSAAASVYTDEIDPLMDTLMLGFINEALISSGARIRSVADTAQRWLYQGLQNGLLAETQTGTVVDNAPDVAAKEIWNLMLAEYPACFAITHVVGQLGLALENWLVEGASMLTLDDQLFADLYRERWDPQQLNHYQRDLLSSLTQTLQSTGVGERLAVAEVSNGEPLLLPTLCARLDSQRTDFVSVVGIAHAMAETEQQLAGFSNTEVVATPDEVCGADLIIVHQDFRSTNQQRQWTAKLSNCLRPGGMLLVLGHSPALWFEQLLQVTAGAHGPAEHVQLDSQYWSQLLPKQGLAAVDALCDENYAGSYAVLAQASDQAPVDLDAPVRTILVLADADAGLAQGLIQQLGDEGQLVPSVGELLEAARQQLHSGSSGVLDIVIPVSFTAMASANCVAQHCANLRDIVAGMDGKGELPVTLHVVTSGATPVNCPTHDRAAQAVAAGGVWGFARTLMNEVSTLKVRLVDVPADWAPMMSQLADVLAEQGEDEQILDGSGHRQVPRLDYSDQVMGAGKSSEDTCLTLEFEQPGQLRTLAWHAHASQALAADEIRVDVKATGLNFRDVMYALGMLSDEAIENGFSGPAMGLEFAGCVTEVGPAVEGYAVGDSVVGFAPSCFSTSVVATADTVAHLPDSVSYEAAATIPTTFFTVYYALKHLAQVMPGERVLIHGAAGGVGLAAIQVAKLLGAEVYATVGSQPKRDVLRLLGIERIYDSRSVSFAEEIRAETGDGVDVVLNSLAGEAINQNLRVLKPFGRFLELGKRDFYENTAIGLRPFRNNISYFGIDSDQLIKARPELTERLFQEMIQLFFDGKLHPLPYTCFTADQVVSAFRHMQQARQIGKVVVTYPERPPAKVEVSNMQSAQRLKLSSEGTYLVTGGLKGFGWKTAQWLVEKGARHLALVSRSGEPESVEGLEQLRSQGVSVQIYPCDVSDLECLAQTLTEIGKGQPVLSGVVHAATTFADTMVVNMTNAQIEDVLGAKMQGALNLQRLLGDLPLDIFVLFSSMTTLFGNPGQANYVAANQSLETLASWRRAQGLAATCVRWGAIDDAGYLARNEHIKSALESRLGGAALASRVALSALEYMLVQDIGLMGVMELEWAKIERYLPNSGAAKYAWLAKRFNGSEEMDRGGDRLTKLLELEPEEQVLAIQASLRQSLGQILMMPADAIDPEQSVYDMGFDSLMGVELVTAIENSFGVSLPAMAISDAPTLTKLSHKVLGHLHGDDEDEDMMSIVSKQHGEAS